MNYYLHYNNLIERARNRLLEGYAEKHHIVPRCLGGDDSVSNNVLLTPEEHYVAHQLLVKMHPGHYGLIKAAHMMSVHNSSNRISNKKFGWLRRVYSQAQKEFYKDKDNHPRGMKGKKHSEETKLKIREFSKKQSLARQIKVYQWNKDRELVKVYDSITDAANAVNSSPSNIKYCCEGKFNQVKKYLWSYNNKCPAVPAELYSGKRKVHTEAGIFDSVTAAVEHFNFSSSKQVRHRCQSKKFVDWYYLD